MKFRDYLLNESAVNQKFGELDFKDIRKVCIVDDKHANTENGGAYPDELRYVTPIREIGKYSSLAPKISNLTVTGISTTDIGTIYVALRGLDRILKFE